ncbi:hypothetical protein RD792_013163 [Penstemon davidsonii]|uniref:non-specific serine/threonine protein kinase n=1 Tax=Penstemon davidsonii TaxID=160366 RepID=A0ABR0CSN3_9LAMI|nr:hypothetical protein RD792_013163 [Penstemon davidsonii]
MSRAYDNWERLVEATLKRELLREIALCPSLSSSSSIDLSSRFDSLDHVNDRRKNSRRSEHVELDTSSSQEVFGSSSSSSTGAIAGRFARLLAAPVIALAHYRRRKPHNHFFDIPEVDLRWFKRFSLRELQVASDNFSNKNILGRGGFGKVYKGRLADGSLVAVKRLKEERTQGGELQFQTEVEIMSMAVHRNLLRLRGFCMTPTERVLVYPYMSNRSVASCLRERPESQPPLDWPKRKRIALGSARGLAYLHDHCNPKIIHRDVKAANIFLDEDFEAIIGDFGLAKLMDHKETHVNTAVRGTIGHLCGCLAHVLKERTKKLKLWSVVCLFLGNLFETGGGFVALKIKDDSYRRILLLLRKAR